MLAWLGSFMILMLMFVENRYEDVFLLSSAFPSEHCKLAIHFKVHLFICF
jgi:hypothetical protein